MNDSTWGNWSDEQLRHPDGRAKGGEPCVQCGESVPPNAHHTHRDRHVCSLRCNRNLRRRLRRRLDRGEVTLPPKPEAPHVDRGGFLFRTQPDEVFPYEFLGWAPLVGDVVERHGSVTAYLPAPSITYDGKEHLVAECLHLNTGATAIVKAEPDGRVGGIWWGCFTPTGARIKVRTFFEHDDAPWIWTWEIFRDVDENGEEYSWSAPVCLPEEHEKLWTPAYKSRSEKLRRISSSTATHVRRERVEADGPIGRIDPRDVFDRDGWVCQLCGEPVDATLKRPDLMSASLDHRKPLAAGGRHRLDNLWTAHLLCNIRKGARYDA